MSRIVRLSLLVTACSIAIAMGGAAIQGGPADGQPTSGNTSTTAGTYPGTCASSQLQLQLRTDQPTLGHEAVILLVQNTGSSACIVEGYPALSLAGGGKTQSTTQKGISKTPFGFRGGLDRGVTHAPTVVLEPNAYGSFLIEGTTNPKKVDTVCPRSQTLTATVGGVSKTFSLSIPFIECTAPQVHPVVSGTAGDQS